MAITNFAPRKRDAYTIRPESGADILRLMADSVNGFTATVKEMGTDYQSEQVLRSLAAMDPAKMTAGAIQELTAGKKLNSTAQSMVVTAMNALPPTGGASAGGATGRKSSGRRSSRRGSGYSSGSESKSSRRWKKGSVSALFEPKKKTYLEQLMERDTVQSMRKEKAKQEEEQRRIQQARNFEKLAGAVYDAQTKENSLKKRQNSTKIERVKLDMESELKQIRRKKVILSAALIAESKGYTTHTINRLVPLERDYTKKKRGQQY